MMDVRRGISLLLLWFLLELALNLTTADRVGWVGQHVLVKSGTLGNPVVMDWRANQSLTYRLVRLSKADDEDNYFIMYVKEADSALFRPTGRASSDKTEPRFTIGWNDSLLSLTISELEENDTGIYLAEVRSEDNHLNKQKLVLYTTSQEETLGLPPSRPKCFSPEAACSTSLTTKATFIFIIVFFIVICVVLAITTYIFYKKASKNSRTYEPPMEQYARYSNQIGQEKDVKVKISNPEQCTDEQSTTSLLVPKSENDAPLPGGKRNKLDTVETKSTKDASHEGFDSVCVRTLKQASPDEVKKDPSVPKTPDDFQSGRSMYYSCDSDDKRPVLPNLDLPNPQFVSNFDVPTSLIRAISTVEIDQDKVDIVTKCLGQRLCGIDENFIQTREEVTMENTDEFVNAFIKEYKLNSNCSSDLNNCLNDESYVFQVERFLPEIRFSRDQKTFSACYLMAAANNFSKRFLVVTAYTINCKLLKQSSAAQDELLGLEAEHIQQYLRCKALIAFKEKGLITKLKYVA